jgi:hypothetical protein
LTCGLLRHDQIVCAGGEHRCSVRMSSLDLLRITSRASPTCASTPTTGSSPTGRARSDRAPRMLSALVVVLATAAVLLVLLWRSSDV